MKDFTNLDPTQVEISRHLAVTEELLARVATQLSGSEQRAEIWTMPDLGLPHSISRILGGFYTGAVYTWTSSVPFVPVDATVNSCGVAVFRTDREVATQQEFTALVERARRTAAQSCYKWNFDEGNHFITLAEAAVDGALPRGRYLVLHSSACEFKHGPQGLYPDHDAWFAHSIRAIEAPEHNRRLRYIFGKTAEQFHRRARMLEEFNRLRQEFFAETILGARHCLDEIVNLPHYGMPAANTVAIGCQWLDGGTRCLLLTAPGAPLFLLKPTADGENRLLIEGRERILQPHGLGMQHRGELRLRYVTNGIEINGQRFAAGTSLKANPAVFIRGTNGDDAATMAARFIQRCPAQIDATLHPLFTYPAPPLN